MNGPTVNPGELKRATGLHPDSCQFPLLDGDDYNAVGDQLYTTTGKGIRIGL